MDGVFHPEQLATVYSGTSLYFHSETKYALDPQNGSVRKSYWDKALSIVKHIIGTIVDKLIKVFYTTDRLQIQPAPVPSV